LKNILIQILTTAVSDSPASVLIASSASLTI
jgi:hypothetical protein